MKIAVDLDGTLCTWHPGAYERAQPFVEPIDRVRRLGAEGHTIWIYTARGSSLGSEQAARDRWEALTLRQLAEWDVPYDRLIMGKPPFDLLIDDRAIPFVDDWLGEVRRREQAAHPGATS